ncbi:MAG TPA: hypothetical protein VNB24_03070 [Acidimicrobiales bacterium]|nr:hypothetical protein [Acidimicrobiales bacterium]
MKPLRQDEEWARQMIRHALAVPVVQHDDNSGIAMHDLNILYRGGTVGAVEVTSAADSESIELWNLLNGGRRWVVEGIAGGWSVGLRPTARARTLKHHLPFVLRRLEHEGIREVRSTGPARTSFHSVIDALGVAWAVQSRTDFAGSVYPTIDERSDRVGGMVADDGNALPPWIGEFASHADRAGERRKLEASGAAARHLFVLLPGFCTAPFGVSHLLMRDNPPLPTVPPLLPAAVTSVWVVSTWSGGVGLRWSRSEQWQPFDKLQPANARSA